MLQIVDVELRRLSAQTAIVQTARLAYVNALKQELVATSAPFGGETIRFG